MGLAYADMSNKQLFCVNDGCTYITFWLVIENLTSEQYSGVVPRQINALSVSRDTLNPLLNTTILKQRLNMIEHYKHLMVRSTPAGPTSGWVKPRTAFGNTSSTWPWKVLLPTSCSGRCRTIAIWMKRPWWPSSRAFSRSQAWDTRRGPFSLSTAWFEIKAWEREWKTLLGKRRQLYQSIRETRHISWFIEPERDIAWSLFKVKQKQTPTQKYTTTNEI